MDLRHLRYFIAVAEELHFTRAAERLGIKQPPLSLQIRQLEQEIGTPLFRRLTRGVELTESGIVLLDKARDILRDVEKTKLSVQMRARGETGRIRLGFAGATYFNPLIPALVAGYRGDLAGDERHAAFDSGTTQWRDGYRVYPAGRWRHCWTGNRSDR